MKHYKKLIRILLLSISLATMIAFSDTVVEAQHASDRLSALEWSPDGSKIATGYRDGSITIVNASDGQIINNLIGHTSGVLALAWSPDSSQLISGSISPDNTVRVWNVATGQEIFQFSDIGLDITTVGWSPDGSFLVAAPAEGVDYVWNAQTGILHSTIQLGAISDIEWNPTGTQFAIAQAAGYIVFYDATTFQMIEEYLDPRTPDSANTLTSIAWNANGTMIASGNVSGQVRVWNTTTDSLILDKENSEYQGNDYLYELTRRVFFSADGNTITGVSGDGTFRTWDISTGNMTSSIQLNAPIYGFATSPDLQLIAYNTDAISQQIIVAYSPLSSTACDSTISASDTASLISAINTGNSAGSPYRICLENSVYSFNAVDNSDSFGANALPLITGDITIIGNGATLSRDSSAPDFRFFLVENGANLNLENLTLDNGHTSGTSDAGDGGAIYNDGTLSLDTVTLSNNIANIEGGAIYNNDNAILTVTTSNFTGNRALGDDGGAIDNHGTATISSTTFADNHADFDDGGAIWNDTTAILTVSDSIFTMNTSASKGAVIMNFGTVNLSNNIITDNNSADDGGAISSDTGTITITGGNFSNNVSGDDGGAIMSYSPLNLTGVTLDNNDASDHGGAIYLWDSDLLIDNSTLNNNTSGNQGGAIYIGNASASSYLNNSCIFANIAGNTTGVYAENDPFDATSNWWGATGGPGGNQVNSNVDFANFVTVDCATALSNPAQAQSQALSAPQAITDTSSYPTVSLPYSNTFDSDSDFSGTVRWKRDASGSGWSLDTDIRGQSSSLEMTNWIDLSNNPQISLTYLERAEIASNDVIRLEIQKQGSSDWIVLSENNGLSYDWQEAIISLADYRGETIRLRWSADIPADAPIGENSLSYTIDELQISRR